MAWPDIGTLLLGTWANVSGPVLTVAVGLVSAIGATWLVVTWRYGDIVSTLRKRLKLAEGQISAFEDGLGGLTLTEAAARLRRVEAYVASLPPRHLDDEQKQTIASAACPPPNAPYLTVVYDATSVEVDGYAQDFVEAFSAAPGWNVVDARYPKLPHFPSLGIGVGLANPGHPTPTEDLVLCALRDAGVVYDVLPKSTYGADAEIIVSAR